MSTKPTYIRDNLFYVAIRNEQLSYTTRLRMSVSSGCEDTVAVIHIKDRLDGQEPCPIDATETEGRSDTLLNTVDWSRQSWYGKRRVISERESLAIVEGSASNGTICPQGGPSVKMEYLVTRPVADLV
jgi:hypothetical protein